MEWQGEGFILGVASYGEGSCLIDVFTPCHGRYRGLFRPPKKSRMLLQVGRRVKVKWRARLETQLGTWTLEDHYLQPVRFAELLDNPLGLNALLVGAALSHELIPERQLYPVLYNRFEELLQALHTSPDGVLLSFFQFNIDLLKELGYGLDLSRCAVTEQQSVLTHVSPRTGRGVCEAVAKLYPGKLVPLPTWLQRRDGEEATLSLLEIKHSFHLIAFFLKKWLLSHPSKAFEAFDCFQNQAMEIKSLSCV